MHTVHINNGFPFKQKLADGYELISFRGCSLEQCGQIFFDFVPVVVAEDDAPRMQFGQNAVQNCLGAAFFLPVHGIIGRHEKEAPDGGKEQGSVDDFRQHPALGLERCCGSESVAICLYSIISIYWTDGLWRAKLRNWGCLGFSSQL